MLRLIGFLMTLSVAVVGIALVDYQNWRKTAIDEERVGLGFEDYLKTLPARFDDMTRQLEPTDGLPRKLADMMPLPPDGWTLRPAVPEDAALYLPRIADALSREDRWRIDSLLAPVMPEAPETVILAYERGERRIVLRAVRYPDSIFTGPASEQRLGLQVRAANPKAMPALRVRGLDVLQEPLPQDMRGRLYVAHVGAQIELQFLISDRVEETELLPFFQTLNVKAMNASVVDKRDGLGDLPVIALATAMEEPLREALRADRATEAARVIATAEAALRGTGP